MEGRLAGALPFHVVYVRQVTEGVFSDRSADELDESLSIAQGELRTLQKDISAAYGYFHGSKIWLLLKLREAFEAPALFVLNITKAASRVRARC